MRPDAALWKRAARAYRRTAMSAEMGRLRARELLESCRTLSEQRARELETIRMELEILYRRLKGNP